MSGSKRRFRVGGTEASASADRTGAERPQEGRKLEDVLRLQEGADPERGPAYSAQAARAFIEGRLTLGDLEGVTKPEQYKIAEIGHGYSSTGKLDEARKIFEGLLALDPYDAYFNAALGSVAQRQARFEDAERHYGRSLELNPYFASVWANRGELRITQGELVGGIRDLQKALELDPDSQEPATLRARVTVQVLQEQLGNPANLAAEAAAAGDATVARVQAAANEVGAGPKKAATRARKARPKKS
ncbi:MAG TPA: hypothetical protein RMG48_04055 [Myxococcales bacterium LLY-WYZ-16_1]|nr:hypothetical protein [Myxococcales bacterium LLY-WYZ-16_1]